MSKKMRTIREAKDMSQEAVAFAAGISTSQLSRYESGKKDPHVGELRKIATKLGVSVFDLIDEPGTGAQYVGEVKTVPVRGLVASGLWFEFTDVQHQSFDQIPIVPTKFPLIPQSAYRVVGPSMDKKRIFDGDYVVCVGYWEARGEHVEAGDLVVVEQTYGGKTERTCKEAVLGRNGVELWPRSTDKRFQEPILLPYAGTHPHIKLVGLVIGVYSPR